ncbi:hypothetical protein N309_02754, partial [Tinamus guttatus]
SRLRRTLFCILLNSSSFDAPVAHSMENTLKPFYICATRGE